MAWSARSSRFGACSSAASWAIPMTLLRLVFFVFALLPLLAVPGLVLADWSLPALLAWMLLRARGELIAAMRNATRIDRARPPQ